jgi:hypothetical protein
MDAEKKPDESGAKPAAPGEPTAPPDALERTNEELAEAAKAEGIDTAAIDKANEVKKPKGLKAFFKRFNVYLLLFGLVVVIAAVVSAVSVLNSKKTPKAPTVATQTLTADALKQLANSDATVGDTGQTLTVEGNAIFSGQVLIQKDLNVAGTIRLGKELSVPQLTVSGNTNLNDTQTNTLQVAQGSTFQGTVTIQHDLNVGGAASFNDLTAGQITISKLTFSGNGQLVVPNHISFSGASPARIIQPNVLGAGGSASINGSDTSGTITINSGNNPTTGCFIALTFNKAFATTPHVLISPVNSAAGSLDWYATRSTTGFSVCTNNAAAANQNFAFDYFVTS